MLRWARQALPAVLFGLYGLVAGANMGDAQTAAAIKKYESLWKHPELFLPWQSDVFDARFLELQKEISDGASAKTLLDKGLLQKEVDGVFSFPMFQLDFCDKFLEEVDNYFASGLPVRRPNSMNNYGLIVNEIGLEPSITHLQQNYILPLARLLYPIQVMMHTHAQKTVPLSPLPLYLSAPLPLSYPPPSTHTRRARLFMHTTLSWLSTRLGTTWVSTCIRTTQT